MENNLPKFIIEDNQLILGKVPFHKILGTNLDKIIGGGWFKFDKENKQLILYGDSHDFGRASKEVIFKAYKENGLGRTQRYVDKFDMKVYYSYELGDELEEIIK